MTQKKKSDGTLTVEMLEEAAKAMTDHSGVPDRLILSERDAKNFIEAIYGSMIDLKVGDWVFVDDAYVAEVIEVLHQNMIIEYKVHVKESVSSRKPIYRIINGHATNVKKVAKGSKLDSLLVFYGRSKKKTD